MIDASVLPDVSALHPELKDPYERMFAAHMLARENALTKVFGPLGDVLSPTSERLQMSWPGGGFFEVKPTGDRKSWIYVTHGLSQPMTAGELTPRSGEEPSGWGLEYVLSSPVKADSWAPDFLIDNVAYLLFDDSPRPFLPGERAKSKVLGERSKSSTLGALIAVQCPDYDGDLRLPGGFCQLIHLVGITPAELEKAKSLGATDRGTRVLLRVLYRYGHGVDTDPARACTTTKPDFERVWAEELSGVDANP